MFQSMLSQHAKVYLFLSLHLLIIYVGIYENRHWGINHSETSLSIFQQAPSQTVQAAPF